MMIPPYLNLIADALTKVTSAATDVKKQLPAEVTKKHWIVSKHSPRAWEDVVFWYAGQENSERETLCLIDTMASLVICETHLRRILKDHEVLKHSPNLKLAKTRRSS